MFKKIAMRLWSLHPRYLDSVALVACWREALLARSVLDGATIGYRHHPQLQRFRDFDDPLSAIDVYLRGLHAEALGRGYRFDSTKIGPCNYTLHMAVNAGQLQYELDWLRTKLNKRSPEIFASLSEITEPESHPLFRVVDGGVEKWEIIK